MIKKWYRSRMAHAGRVEFTIACGKTIAGRAETECDQKMCRSSMPSEDKEDEEGMMMMMTMMSTD
jgi:hypothetical protein